MSVCSSSDSTSERYSELSALREGLFFLQRALERLECGFPHAGGTVPRDQEVDRIQRLVNAILSLRRRRNAIFDDDLFGEPAWDMLLELYSVELRSNRETVSGLCYASGAPLTTALRWIGLLQKQGWVTKYPDPLDGRRCFVSLTPRATAALDAFFGQPELSQVL